ncbi:MAG TPA: bifunctional phosphoribosyl-AMP cyclohydrolase/phosphoribosyl-ATP diphosphatase HisIE [Povalibacter sp.]|nr:bifunctional phosphoribosyl-AMP cyclohydrolase/phosphoribosyl-ATP diphosphatase HisIE [Povalibacter sp.]
MTPAQIAALDWSKGGGLLPAVVQDALTGKVLMLGYMNAEALRATLDSRRVTFFSRSKNRLWTKGETSGNFLNLVTIAADCDNDSLLVQAHPDGPTCHTGRDSCFTAAASTAAADFAFLSKLESVIAQRIADQPTGSYTARIWSEGPTRLAQKVGEEGVEVALAAVTQEDGRLVSEAADLLFHLALLLKSRDLSLANAVKELEQRHAAKP